MSLSLLMQVSLSSSSSFFSVVGPDMCFLFTSRGYMQAPPKKYWMCFSPQILLWGDTLHLIRKWRFVPPSNTHHAKDYFFLSVNNELLLTSKILQHIQAFRYIYMCVCIYVYYNDTSKEMCFFFISSLSLFPLSSKQT